MARKSNAEAVNAPVPADAEVEAPATKTTGPRICSVCGALKDPNHAHKLADGTIER